MRKILQRAHLRSLALDVLEGLLGGEGGLPQQQQAREGSTAIFAELQQLVQVVLCERKRRGGAADGVRGVVALVKHEAVDEARVGRAYQVTGPRQERPCPALLRRGHDPWLAPVDGQHHRHHPPVGAAHGRAHALPSLYPEGCVEARVEERRLGRVPHKLLLPPPRHQPCDARVHGDPHAGAGRRHADAQVVALDLEPEDDLGL
mmetsp:Transcript_11722/g.28685  ORF Transcript_11722/g.28685 Transcript_11722/m.28685 type:complete len:204 (+) Transcript_11722:1482-2093(+)